MQRNISDNPMVFFTDAFYKGSLIPGNYYVRVKNRLLEIYYTRKTTGQISRVSIYFIPDPLHVIQQIESKNPRGAMDISQEDRAKLTQILGNYHQHQLQLSILCRAVVFLFREYFVMDKEDETLLHETAYACLNCVNKLLRFGDDTIPNELGETFLHLLRRYLMAAVTTETGKPTPAFSALVNFMIDPKGFFARENPAYLDAGEFIVNNTAQLQNIFNLVNDELLLFPASHAVNVLKIKSTPMVIAALKCVLEKILLPAIIIACKVSFEGAVLISEFLNHLQGLQIDLDYKYNTAVTRIPKNECIMNILRILEIHFLRTIDYRTHATRADLARNSQLLNTLPSDSQKIIRVLPDIDTSRFDSCMLFRHKKPDGGDAGGNKKTDLRRSL